MRTAVWERVPLTADPSLRRIPAARGTPARNTRVAEMAQLKVNGETREIPVADAPLLFVLRNDLKLNGPKFGCGLAQCGACTVLADGQPLRSCVTTTRAVLGQEITTLEGLGTLDKPHRLQKAMIEEQAMQCGY